MTLDSLRDALARRSGAAAMVPPLHRRGTRAPRRARGAALIVGYHGRPVAWDMCMLTVALYDRLGYLPHGVVHRGRRRRAPLEVVHRRARLRHPRRPAPRRGGRARRAHLVTTPGGANEGCRGFRAPLPGRLGHARRATCAWRCVPLADRAGRGARGRRRLHRAERRRRARPKPRRSRATGPGCRGSASARSGSSPSRRRFPSACAS